jgi:hypothetical protein
VPGADADEIDEIGDEVTARAQRLLKSARERRARAEDRGRANGLDHQIADVEEQTAIDLERNEQTLHELADIARRAEANGIIDADHA